MRVWSASSASTVQHGHAREVAEEHEHEAERGRIRLSTCGAGAGRRLGTHRAGRPARCRRRGSSPPPRRSSGIAETERPPPRRPGRPRDPRGVRPSDAAQDPERRPRQEGEERELRRVPEGLPDHLVHRPAQGIQLLRPSRHGGARRSSRAVTERSAGRFMPGFLVQRLGPSRSSGRAEEMFRATSPGITSQATKTMTLRASVTRAGPIRRRESDPSRRQPP